MIRWIERSPYLHEACVFRAACHGAYRSAGRGAMSRPHPIAPNACLGACPGPEVHACNAAVEGAVSHLISY